MYLSLAIYIEHTGSYLNFSTSEWMETNATLLRVRKYKSGYPEKEIHNQSTETNPRDTDIT